MITFEGGYNDPAAHSIAQIVPQELLSHMHLTDLAKGRVDQATQLAEAVASNIRNDLNPNETRHAPVVVASRHGNAEMVERFTASQDAGRPSPVTYSASGYNIIAQATARGFQSSGSSVILAGQSASLERAYALASIRMRATGAETGLAIASHSWRLGDTYANVVLALVLRKEDVKEGFDHRFLDKENPNYTDDLKAITADISYLHGLRLASAK